MVAVARPDKPCDSCEPKTDAETGKMCASNETIVCTGNGGSGLITLGNVLPGALGESCAAGDVYCCDHDATSDGNLVNLDVNAQCSLNHVL
ncbi:hypothetical protein N7533_009937 [Penicillium manginii]|uniref:uncharacterized protein n=1 Tax=Penicillium manginii TaxID=203109 RepID=UPI0025489A11|nr:uncharacterized protein N7533_010638 [Penicillium manginii]XP_056955804.1 uncharacterized protein N7533_009937 [Penicillium manginii]KAJ5741229.1 hypothetical protein N7533_010638 [Penicillium manginii]KAJ5742835.1 hypothetical protein N7533_009937 [Penicillium manginii]